MSELEIFRRVERYEKIDKKVLENLVKNFPREFTREKKIISLHYGLFNNREYSIKEIADKLDRSKTVITRLEDRALRYLGLYKWHEINRNKDIQLR